MDTHLTVEDIEKYLNTSDLSEDYLLWLEQASAHLASCESCQKTLQRAMSADAVCEEAGLQEALRLAEKEDEIRRSILICKLSQMREQTRMAEIIRLLQTGAVSPYILQMSDLSGRQTAVRGETGKSAEELELTCEDGRLKINIYGRDSGHPVTVLLEQEGEPPVVCEALWEEASGQWSAVLDAPRQESTFELYILS
ncbi:MAG: hypothetical protein J6B10_07440 [Lachnospiraceae bacterium]|nr:hypothetical protein [Lachnospiraceae bacterium]